MNITIGGLNTLKLFLKITLISILGLTILLIICFALLKQWFYSYQPSPGIWQCNDEDMEITIYVSTDGGTATPAGFNKCKVEISYNGKIQKAILSYHTEMYQCNLVYVDDFDDIMKPEIEYGGNNSIHFMYNVPMKKGEWEFAGVRTASSGPRLVKDYSGKSLIFKRIGKYKEPE